MNEPKFIPKPGQVDYTDIRYCPVINCVIRYGDEILLEKRSESMRLYPGYWSGVSGFLDDNGPIEEKAHEELREEFGITRNQVASIERGQVLVQEAPDYGKTWIVFPLRVTLTEKITPKTNWEVAATKWLSPAAAQSLSLLPGFEQVLATFYGDIIKAA